MKSVYVLMQEFFLREGRNGETVFGYAQTKKWLRRENNNC